MLARKLTKTYSIEEYLKLENRSNIKHEFHNGELYAMAGGTVNHSTLTANILTELNNSLRKQKGSCRTHTSDMKIHIKDDQNNDHFVYPDVSITCDEKDHQNRDRLNHPKLIVEVLSKSTELYDRSDKFELYKTLSPYKTIF